MKKKEELFIFTDGGSQGNPGPAAIGFVIKNSQGEILHQEGKPIGITTNNIAEYKAVVEALLWLFKNKDRLGRQVVKINFYLDSQLVVNQLNGFYKIKNAKLRELIIKVREGEQGIILPVSYYLIPREKNFLADNLVKRTLSYSPTNSSWP